MIVSEISHLYELIKSSEYLVLKCGASWCIPCQNIDFYGAKQGFKGTFAEIDIDAVKESFSLLKDDFGLTTIPYFMIWEGGEFRNGLQTSETNVLQSFFKDNLELEVPEGMQHIPKKKKNEKQPNEEIIRILEDALSGACEAIRNSHSIDFDEHKALMLLQGSLQHRNQRKQIPEGPKIQSRLKHIESAKHWKQMIEETIEGKPLVVDCWMTGCKPCKKIGPKFEQLSNENPEATYAKADIGHKDILEFGKEQGLKKIPFFMVYKDGVLMEETLQHSDEGLVRDFISRTLKAPVPKKLDAHAGETTQDDFDDFAMDDDF